MCYAILADCSVKICEAQVLSVFNIIIHQLSYVNVCLLSRQLFSCNVWQNICLYRNNETYLWTDSHIAAAGSVWTIVRLLQPYSQYQFQLVMHNESVLQSAWITTAMDGINIICVSSALYTYSSFKMYVFASTMIINALVFDWIFCCSSKPRTIC